MFLESRFFEHFHFAAFQPKPSRQVDHFQLQTIYKMCNCCKQNTNIVSLMIIIPELQTNV